MKPIRINHFRCDEYKATTYVFAPEDWDDVHIAAKLNEARNLYLNAAQAFKEANPQPPGGIYGRPPFEDHPDKTVREVLEIHEAQKVVIRAWQERQREARRSFEEILVEAGFTSLHIGLDSDDAFEVHWGHQHGTFVDYSETETDSLPTPQQSVQGDDEDDEN